MATVDLELLKKHVHADDFTDDDEYLQHLLGAAEQYVCTATNRTKDELLEAGGGDFPAMLQQAVLLTPDTGITSAKRLAVCRWPKYPTLCRP